MSKVKITQEQADAIEGLERIWSEDEIIARNVKGRVFNEPYNDSHRRLEELTLYKLVHVLKYGYEVEPEYKVGEWATDPKGDVGKIGTVKGRMLHADWGSYRAWISKSKVVHSTPEEIEKEKECRTNKKLNDLLCNLSSEEKSRLYEKLVSLI